MYCKFCGNTIASNTTKCTACGANIDLNDGGQSFFDDNELDAWQSDSLAMKGPKTYMPKTEMREASDSSFEENYETYLQRPQASSSSRGSRSQVPRKKKKKTILDYLNLSSSNRLIIFCIASALAIVLLVVAIIAVISGGDKEEQTEGQATNSGYSQTIDDQTTTSSAQQTEIRTDNNIEQDKTETNNETVKDKTEIKDMVIKKGEKELSNSALGYDINGVVYVALYDILKHEGYRDKYLPDDGNPVYDHNKDKGSRIGVKLNAKDIWFISDNDSSKPPQYLEYNIYEIDGVIYVPAESFLENFGCEKVDYDTQKKTLYYEK